MISVGQEVVPLQKPNRIKRRVQRVTAGQRTRRLVPFPTVTRARKKQRLLATKARKVRKAKRRDRKRNK